MIKVRENLRKVAAGAVYLAEREEVVIVMEIKKIFTKWDETEKPYE
jgi:hypothetical protein